VAATDPPAAPAASPPKGDPPADERLTRLEATQAEQGTKLDKILDLIAGDEQAAHGDAQHHVESKLDRSSSIKDLVAAAVKDVGAQEKADADRAAHAAEHERLKAPPAEPRPEDPPQVEPTRKQRLQRSLFGGDPS
jgi:uncharacterized coiled-coil protein SlyX